MQLNPVAYAERKSILPKNIFLASIYIIILIIIITAIISFVSAYRITHPSKLETPQISSNIAPNYKNISFYTGDAEEKINGWYFPSGTSKTSVLLVHGYGKNRLQFDEDTFKLISRLTNEGLNVLTIDLRGSGNSAGSMSTFGRNETQDVLSSIKYLKQQGTDKIILIGFSTGASSCLSAAAESPYKDSIIGVIGDSPYSIVDNYIDYAINSSSIISDTPARHAVDFFIKKLTKVSNDMDIIPKLPLLTQIPLLLIDGFQQDIPASDNTRLLYEMYYRKNPANANYWNSGAPEYCQSFSHNPEKYMDKVAEFIRVCIKDSNRKK
ncbi:alpha/beta fold hydrolase [Ruminiclostridium herbifermentans]|uniref:Alpha/beta fold hydrolase n=1 Tax=Ruminiclostridium herbifermentans TaxID=2488810 RepID=A0A4U7JGM4_9FIRM|nr:alpha/beta fold hydrolase [Ruminiclostridium herbifermentans]QNU67128.1 alpha/beta fold hydrolase [Ruminiclostridium herbifermentans]